MMRKKAKAGTKLKKVKKAQGGKLVKSIKNNKKVLSKMNKKGPKKTPTGTLTNAQKREIKSSFDNQVMERFNSKLNPTQEALDNSYNTPRRKPSLTNKKSRFKSGTTLKKAKSGTKMKKAQSGSTLKKAPAGSKGKGMRSLPKAVRNKIGFAKKGKTVKKAGYGTKAKKAKSGCSTRRKKK